MSKRPFIQQGIEDLEALFDEKRDDARFLQTLIHELGQRKTQRARDLKTRAVSAAGTARKSEPGRKPELVATAPTTAPNTSATPPAQSTFGRRPASVQQHPQPEADMPPLKMQPAPPPPKIENKPDAVLSAWTAMEVLSPPGFRRSEDLAGGDRYRIAKIDGASLPWENGGEKSRPNQRLYYQIILGSVDMEAAIGALLKVYTDSREELPQARGEAVLATVMVDREGRPVEQNAVSISSFGWGIPVALAGNLHALGQWSQVEKALIENLTKRLVVEDKEGRPRPLSQADISGAYAWLLDAIKLDRRLCRSPALAVKSYQYFKLPDPPESILLNSFFLDDLAQAGNRAEDGSLPSNLKRYLGLEKPASRRNLMDDRAALAQALQPKNFPLGAWPANGRHPLVLLQQCAVNLAHRDLKSDGILAVNGPPGTGKTTLLRDIIASTVTERAKALCGYDDPEDAFTHSGEKLKRGNAFIHLYRPDQKIRGYEMIVASSNNKAVENVSVELPGSSAIADDAKGLRYFKTVSDAVLERDTWGVITAVLGNAQNRSTFRQKFWWDDETGMQKYLQQASGNPQLITEKTDSGTRQRPPHIVQREKPPEDHSEALGRWRAARRAFKEAVAKAEKALAALQTAHELYVAIRRRQTDIEKLENEIATATEQQGAAVSALQSATTVRDEKSRVHQSITGQRDLSQREKPGLLAWLFRRAEYRRWRERHQGIVESLAQAASTLKEAENTLAARQADHTEVAQALSRLQAMKNELLTVQEQETAKLNASAKEHGGVFITGEFFERSHRDRQITPPWLDKTAAHLRHDVFEAAMALHQAFVAGAAKPIRHNLNVLMDGFGTRSLGSPERDALIPDLWATLFLVVPVISTTFASVSRMFGRIEPEAFGWLLIDEAGQALPQAAVGAFMRTRKAVVVGDPIQIEPVVTLPDQLTEAMCKQFGIDPLIYNAPAASAQTLADSATGYFGTFESKYGTREVGVPLLVHRRCGDPMFSISNAIAYENLMVQAKAPKPSAIIDALGPSRWIDVRGRGRDKWCAEEGNEVVGLLRQMRAAGCDANIYIVTPFVVVQDRMRDLALSSGLLDGWAENPRAWSRERIGTVHTVQGREAEAVLFVLGAPNPEQRGARGWAGGRPNLLNVATTRAQEAFYVVGNKELWRNAGVFQALHDMLD